MSDSQPVLLLIGGDPYAIRGALRHGLNPVVVHSPFTGDWGPLVSDWSRMPIPEGAHAVFSEDATSIERVLFSLHRQGVVDREIVGIQTSSEEALVTAAALGRVLGVPAIDAGTAVRFRDKSVQKRLVSAAGVAAAASQIIEDVHEPDLSGIDDFGVAVLKPVAGGGTRNTSIVRSRAELAARCAEYRRLRIPQRAFVLEEFIDGDEWVVEGVVFDGQIQFFCVGSYSEPCLAIVESNGVMRGERFDPSADADVYEMVRPMAETTVKALGLESGVFHLELFRERGTGRLVFGECAARRGGGLTHEVVECKFGVDLGAASVLCAAGIDPRIEPSIRPGTVGSTFLPGRAGVVASYPSPVAVAARPGVEHVRLEQPYGTRLAGAANTIAGVGQVVVSGRSREEFSLHCDLLTQWFDEQLVVIPDDASNQDRRDWQAAHWPDTASFFPTYSKD
ncbi:hypothetical protein [Amycolatopsis sp. NPDC004169]|uniref:ATP-grasp domain-containing protein n=1 Tax=Amycolatopsis sp. NPDC004169 TaxID=3154453 RepID=UPI00339FAEB1